MVAAAIAVVAACGGGGGSSGPTVPTNPNLTIDALDIKFDKKEYSVAAGEVRVAYISKGAQTHTLVVQSPEGAKIDPKLRVAPGKETGGVYHLPAGKYTLYCDIAGHREAGMVAELTVRG
jgi:uncharacterized cupredoxin-like copper-binding protein